MRDHRLGKVEQTNLKQRAAPSRSHRCSGDILNAKATAGGTHLGGEDFDNLVFDFCMQDFKRRLAQKRSPAITVPSVG